MPGAPGRWPFAGHVRGRWESGPVQIAWAGRVAHSALPEEAWEAAEALRDVLAGVVGDGRLDVLARAWSAIDTLPDRWKSREDLCILLAARDPAGTVLSGAGLTAVLVEGQTDWVAAALSGSPLFTEPGAPARAPVPQPSLRPGFRFVGLPKEAILPKSGEIAAACGVRAQPAADPTGAT
ncbi:MAG: hypothetical protein EXR69_12685 [Myxococcales bacterium]|nr:hypothetical protein [Myxococcales bacterium]